MSNARNMRAGLNLIEADQMGWDQHLWRKCFAAKVCEAAGAEWRVCGNDSNTRSEWFVILPQWPEEVLTVRSAGARLMDLDPKEYEAITGGERTLEELRHIVGLYELREEARGDHVAAANPPVYESMRELVGL